MPAPIALLHAERFNARLTAEQVAGAVGGGLQAALPGWLLPAIGDCEQAELKQLLRRQQVRALVLAAPSLCRSSGEATAAEALAAEARQAGLPAFAITALRQPNLFRARIFDLQLVLVATTAAKLRQAGGRIGAEMLSGGLGGGRTPTAGSAVLEIGAGANLARLARR